jgi:glycosyltransferase involved in cell wall biosynthesis
MTDSSKTQLARSRVVMLLPGLDRVGGAELQAWRLAAILRRCGQPVHMVGPGSRKSVNDYLKRAYISDPPSFTPIWTPFNRLRGYNIFWGYLHKSTSLALMFIWLSIYRSHYDIVHGHLMSQTGALCGIVSWLWNKTSIVKVSGSGRNSDISRVLSSPLRYVNRLFFRHIDIFINTTKHIATELISILDISQEKMHHIPNGVDIVRYHPATATVRQRTRERFDLPCDMKIVLFVGRLESRKRVDLLLKAWQTISNKHDAILLVAGRGRMMSELKSLCSNLKLDRRVIFHGYSSDVNLLMQTADIFVLPSATEGMPNVLLEAMASGLPAILSEIPAYTGIISHLQNGYLCEDTGHKPLAEAIHTLLSDESLAKRLGDAGRISIEQRYNLDDIANRYLKLYEHFGSQPVKDKSYYPVPRIKNI